MEDVETIMRRIAQARSRWPGCKCRWDWKPLGRLHGVNMGHGAVRARVTEDCPYHGQGRDIRRCVFCDRVVPHVRAECADCPGSAG